MLCSRIRMHLWAVDGQNAARLEPAPEAGGGRVLVLSWQDAFMWIQQDGIKIMCSSSMPEPDKVTVLAYA